MADTPNKPADPRLARALELINEAEKLTQPGDPGALGRASANAEAAINMLDAFVAATPTPEARNLLSAAWMRRGVAHLVLGTEGSLTEAIRCFDESIRLRRDLLRGQVHPALVHAQASTFMARGDALVRSGGEAGLRQALGSYDEGITLFRALPVREVPQLMMRLILALGSRAAALEALRSAGMLPEAVQAHRDIAALIRGTPAEQHPEFRLHLGAALANVANLQLVAGTTAFAPDQSRAAAEDALGVVAGLERENPVAGEIGIKARRSICRAIAALIELRPGTPAPREFLSAMTDAADEALALGRFWEAKGLKQFRPLAIEMFGFGATLYVRHQTHFFAEFVLDNLDPERSSDAYRDCPEMHRLAAALTEDALRHFERDRVVTTETAGVERQLETLRSLREASERLAALKPAAPATDASQT